MSGEALDAIFGIYVKNAAQRCVREVCSCSVALFPSSVALAFGVIGGLLGFISRHRWTHGRKGTRWRHPAVLDPLFSLRKDRNLDPLS